MFIETLEEVGDGETLFRLDKLLKEVTAAVTETGKAGSVTLKITLKPNGEQGVNVIPDASSKLPQKPLRAGFFYTHGEGTLSRRHPTQMDIEDKFSAIDKRRTDKHASDGDDA